MIKNKRIKSERELINSLPEGGWSFPSKAGINRKSISKKKDQIKKSILINALNERHMTIMIKELSKISKLFHKEGISFIVLKKFSLYNLIGARQSADIDLLIKKRNLLRATSILKKNNYSYNEERRNKEYWIKKGHHLPLINKHNHIKIELHWRIDLKYSPFKIKNRDLWRDSIEQNIKGLRVITLSYEQTVIHLAIHSLYNHKAMDIWPDIKSISLIIKKIPLDWDRLWYYSNRWKTDNFVYIALSLAQKEFNVKLPEVYKNKLNRNSPQLFILKQLVKMRAYKEEKKINLISDILWEILLTEGLVNRINIIQRGLYALSHPSKRTGQ